MRVADLNNEFTCVESQYQVAGRFQQFSVSRTVAMSTMLGFKDLMFLLYNAYAMLLLPGMSMHQLVCTQEFGHGIVCNCP